MIHDTDCEENSEACGCAAREQLRMRVRYLEYENRRLLRRIATLDPDAEEVTPTS
jgi:hypothetical protein